MIFLISEIKVFWMKVFVDKNLSRYFLKVLKYFENSISKEIQFVSD